MIENEKVLIENGFDWYYIGCSKMSAGILKSFGQEPYSSDVEHDLYKFNVDLTREKFKEIYKSIIADNINIKIV